MDMIKNQEGDLAISVDGALVTATLNRPAARNAMTFEMYENLADLCRAIDRDHSIKALIITGAGSQAFSSGTDISQFTVFETEEDGWAYEERMERVLSAIESCRVPTIAAISGACTGGGAAIAACCDIRITTDTLKFGFPIARTLGNCLSIANYGRLVDLIGPARVKDLIFRARLVGSDEALSIGLVTQVVSTHEELLLCAREIAERIMQHAPLTMQTCKTALLRLREEGIAANDKDLIATCYMSDDFREGMTAFLEKRSPRWTGR
ncbi:enoyl-CoA hydratase/isomerase family protein [Rhizobiales bacterium TNE-4]|nr:enoyl-CoA hydratase/isomerase family protein [Rhizobiales bacterium TNE-4]MBV1826451.1 enoyl-CoA hydratase/isomerase family protein [Rhizobiales bacterium TNE-4]